MPPIAATLLRLSVIFLITFLPLMAKAEPRVLSASELDDVTAGMVFVQIDAVAEAFGYDAETHTDASTTAISTSLFDLAYGIGQSRAVACCGPTADAKARASAIGRGASVLGGSEEGGRFSGASLEAFSNSWVVAYDITAEASYWQHYVRQVVERVAHDVQWLALRTVPVGAPGID